MTHYIDAEKLVEHLYKMLEKYPKNYQILVILEYIDSLQQEQPVESLPEWKWVKPDKQYPVGITREMDVNGDWQYCMSSGRLYECCQYLSLAELELKSVDAGPFPILDDENATDKKAVKEIVKTVHKEVTRQVKEMVKEQPVEGLEEEIARYLREECSADDEQSISDVARHFAEWGEKNAYKAIMKKADEVRDKRFDTDYEVKIEPAAGFDLGCVNVYHEGKLVGQYVGPKEEKKLPEGLDEAAEEQAKKYAEEQKPKDADGEIWKVGDVMVENQMSYEDGFIAGAEYQRKQDQSLIELAEDHAMLAGMNKMEEQMLEDAVEIEVKEDAGGFPIVPLDAIELYDYENDKPLAKAGDKVRVIVIPNTDEK